MNDMVADAVVAVLLQATALHSSPLVSDAEVLLGDLMEMGSGLS